MKKIYMRDYSSNNFDKIVNYVLYPSDYGNEQIIDDMVYYLLEHYQINDCTIDYSADLKTSGGIYHPTNGEISIKIGYLSHPIAALEVLAHEIAHKVDNEKRRIPNMADYKNTTNSIYSLFPSFSNITLSQRIFKTPFNAYQQYYYYSNPTEVFARQEAMKITKKLLTKCKNEYKNIKNKSQKKEAKNQIETIKNVIKSQKNMEMDYLYYKIHTPLTTPIAKFVVSRIGKKLYKQIKTNRVDEHFQTNLSSWMLTFETPNLNNEASKNRLMEIVEMTKENPDLYRTTYAQLQNLGFVDDSPKAVQSHMTDIMKDMSMMNQGNVVFQASGEEKANLKVADLISKFSQAGAVLNDRILLNNWYFFSK